MPLEIRCTNCGKTLRVGDQHAGKQVRCPACQQISIAPAADSTAGMPGRATSSSTWHMRTPEGQTYGPVAWSQLQNWAGEGRLAGDCFVAESPAGPWRGAAELFPSLTPQRPAPVAVPPPTMHTWLPPDAAGDETAPFAAAYAPFAPGAAAGRYTVPHRGGLILVLGLLGFMINCPIFCFMAWVMGSSDLREMRAGRMDPSGESLTQVGRVLGMILSIFWIFAFVFFGFIILLAAVSGQ